MKAIDAIKEAAKLSGTPTTHIGPAIGRKSTYVSTIAYKNNTPQTDNTAAMLDVCGYALCAIPKDKVPPGAIVIDE